MVGGSRLYGFNFGHGIRHDQILPVSPSKETVQSCLFTSAGSRFEMTKGFQKMLAR